MKALAIVALLAVQAPDVDLEQDSLLTRSGSAQAMVTLIATYPDGTPLRGFIQCGGTWFKHADEADVLEGEALPFRTDSRGAIIVNPHVEDEWITCWASGDGAHGKVLVELSDRPTIQHIVLQKES